MNSMPVWHSGMCLFNPELDAQHITLLVLGSGLVEAVEGTSNADQHCLDLLQDIAALAGRHHATEEALLEKNGCPSCADIKAAHARTGAMLAGLVEDAEQGRLDHGALVSSMTEWMTCHLNQSDMAVRPYLGSWYGSQC